jgi:hypothetical protein
MKIQFEKPTLLGDTCDFCYDADQVLLIAFGLLSHS